LDEEKRSSSEEKSDSIQSVLVRPADNSPKSLWEMSQRLYEALTGKKAADKPSQEIMDKYGLKPEDFD